MSMYKANNHYSTGIPNGFPAQMDDQTINKVVYLDVTPARHPQLKHLPANAVVPLKNNLFEGHISRDIVYENIKPVLAILRVMGIVPLTKLSTGMYTFQITSPTMVYSAIMFFSLVSYVLYLSLHKVQILRTAEGKFEEAVIEYLFTVYLFPMTVVPIMWYETRKIAGVLNSWVDFEVS